MKAILSDLNHWPRNKKMEPIFGDTHDALLYAHLIYNLPGELDKLIQYRQSTRDELKKLRNFKHPKLNYLMSLACKSQFFREAIEEYHRIHHDNKKEKP